MRKLSDKKIYLDDFYKNIICLCIFIMPIIRYYNFWGLNIGLEALLKIFVGILLVLLILVPNRPKYYYSSIYQSGKSFLGFALYAVIISLLYDSFSKGYQTRSFNIMIVFIASIFLIFLILIGEINFKVAFKIYSFFIWLMVIICFIQWLILLSGHRIPFNLPGLEYSDAWKQLSTQTFGMYENPTALFSEKAHFCEYLIPYVAICLFDDNIVSTHRIIKAIIVSIFVILTVSGNGFVLVFLCWGLYFTFFNEFDKKNKALILILGFLIIVISFISLTRVDTINSMLSVLFTNNQYGYSKANYRVYRGFDVFSRLPLTQKITGVGYYRMQDFANIHNIVSIYDRSWGMYEYFSAFTQILIYFGIIGFILFLLHVIPLVKKQSNLTKGLLVVFIAISLSSEILFQGFHIMFLTLIVASIQLNEDNTEFYMSNN